MYTTQPNGAEGATINPATLNPELLNQTSRGLKRSRSPDHLQGAQSIANQRDDDPSHQRKRNRPMKSARTSGGLTDLQLAQQHSPIPPPPMAQPSHGQQTLPPPHTPQSQNAPLPGQTASYSAPQTSPPPKMTPTKSTLKALPTVRDHTTDQLGPGGDEYIPRETDEQGEKKVLLNGTLTGGREYRCRTFLVPNRGDKLFMLATECARVLGYRDSYLLFNKNRSLFKIIANQVEKDDLVSQEILPFSYRSRQIAIVTARSMFRQFGSRVIVNGRRVRDDYWEQKARKQGFTEADLAGEKRPGAAKAREAAAEANNAATSFTGGPSGEIIYTNNPGFGGAPAPQPFQTDLNDTRTRDYSNFIKGGPRQEIAGHPYQDQTRPTPLGDIHQQAHHTAEYNRGLNQQRDMRGDYLQNLWRRPHEQPASSQPVGPSDSQLPVSRPGQSPHASNASIQAPGIVSNQSPQMMMTAAPYSQPIHSQQPLGQGQMRTMPQPTAQKQTRPSALQPGGSSSLSQGSPAYNYGSSGQMWGPQTQQAPQHYPGYGGQTQPSPHQQQSPAPQLRHPGATGGQMQPGSVQYSGMPGMGQSYPPHGQSMYPADQSTPRQFMPPNSAGSPSVTQGWPNPQTSAGGNWWANQQQ
ncbi:chromatin structure-remodeling complex protein RSC7 [Microdochium nivale]|nr:chromatin structure-remodeling complex protein RSC7 [Microdochium nivale]